MIRIITIIICLACFAQSSKAYLFDSSMVIEVISSETTASQGSRILTS
jgi:hypothetical protein